MYSHNQALCHVQKKISSFKNAKKPHSRSDMKSFLGLTNYVARFIHNYYTITESLRNLLQKNAPFKWTTEQENRKTR